MSYLKATDENSNTYRFSLMPANDKTSSLFPAVKTVKVSASYTLSFGNISYVSGRKYYVNVKFRTRGDGDSTTSKCSSVGFIANRSDWQNSYSYIHNSATAYAERGQIVEWTFEFTATANESRATALYFIINNAWANGYDNQTIDLFYYKMWDWEDNVYAESSSNVNLLKNCYWKDDGSPLSTEKAVVNDNLTLTGNSYWIEHHNYVLEFDLKLDADEINKDDFILEVTFKSKNSYFSSFNTLYIRKREMDYTYKHYRNIIHSDFYDYALNREIYILFKIYANEHKAYVKNVTLKTYYSPMMFLKVTKNSVYYFLKTFINKGTIVYTHNPKQLKLTTADNKIYYLAQNMTEYKYNELASRTHQDLFDKFTY